ncbi:hypothetical protein I302_107388 [Kwoniella bestiolae CBS 10118]|uniref:Uncharacterized protein n=1 Tax=Kwoniella bestiolae CBS 10118 TaxID=1296100 RepID=A0A1B9FYN7_9TREE|nr:hypothetical protein I302_06874 [Kwoniella bestiolae CBS 10118]OCF23888.1 hypothetical protein I302_06874 [Kwoniella bestiolae CBS 10118]
MTSTTSTTTPSSSKGVYVPPHLRNRSNPSPSSASSSSRNSSNPPATPPSSSRPYSAPNRSNYNSRSPWSHSSSLPSSHSGRNHFTGITSPSSKGFNNSSYGNALTSGHSHTSSPSSSNPSNGYSSGPSLYVYGDSFVGPFKLLREDSVRVQTFKGSSAKGLNNPNSIKQVSKDLLPIINGLLAPPPYAYMPSGGRWVMLIFGNVDLQINYLWQLANKPISHLSFPPTSNSQQSSSSTKENIENHQEDEEDSSNGQPRFRRPSNVLATATETSAKGPALGPELFVESVVKAYTSWLEREIVNGPIGKRIRERQSQPQTDGGSGVTRRTPPASKVLIAAALPPLVEDELLPRIPEKYVERLEEDHSKAQKAMERMNNIPDERGSRTPWANKQHRRKLSLSPTPRSSTLPEEDLDVGVSTLSLSDNTSTMLSPSSPRSTSSNSSHASTLFDSQRTANSTDTMTSSIHSLPKNTESSPNVKTPVLELLAHDPPLCTLPVRVGMTNRFNALIKQYCETHPDILGFVDITPSMREGSEQPSIHGEVDRNVWACPVDPTNVHPLWEPTLPLWKDELARQGIPVESWRISEDAQETFRAYEVDKRRRTEKRGDQRDVDGGVGRIKLRDE